MQTVDSSKEEIPANRQVLLMVKSNWWLHNEALILTSHFVLSCLQHSKTWHVTLLLWYMPRQKHVAGVHHVSYSVCTPAAGFIEQRGLSNTSSCVTIRAFCSSQNIGRCLYRFDIVQSELDRKPHPLNHLGKGDEGWGFVLMTLDVQICYLNCSSLLCFVTLKTFGILLYLLDIARVWAVNTASCSI